MCSKFLVTVYSKLGVRFSKEVVADVGLNAEATAYTELCEDNKGVKFDFRTLHSERLYRIS